MGGDLTEVPELPESPIEMEAYRLKKKWGRALRQLIGVMDDTNDFVVKYGRDATIAALGSAIAARIHDGYAAFAPVLTQFSKRTSFPALPEE